jgi:hypothetical protein
MDRRFLAIALAALTCAGCSPAANDGMLAVKWPTDLNGATITIDGQTPSLVGSSGEFQKFAVGPGKHTVRIARPGFQPLVRTVDLATPGDDPIVPLWVPEAPAKQEPSVTASNPAATETAKPDVLIKIEHARWGGGEKWADVTQRVKRRSIAT